MENRGLGIVILLAAVAGGVFLYLNTPVKDTIGVGVCAYFEDGSSECLDTRDVKLAQQAVFTRPDNIAISYLEVYTRVTPVYSGTPARWDLSDVHLEVSLAVNNEFRLDYLKQRWNQDWSGRRQSGVSGMPPVPSSGQPVLIQKVTITPSEVEEWVTSSGDYNFAFKGTALVTLYDSQGRPSEAKVGSSTAIVGLNVQKGGGTVTLSSISLRVQPCAMLPGDEFGSGAELRCVG